MPKRNKSRSGEGGLYHRKDGRWDAYISVRTLEGPKVLRTTKSTKQEAQRWLNEKRYQRDQGTLTKFQAETMTFGQYLDMWLRESVEGTVARHTYRDYRDKVEKHLKPALGHVRLKELTAAHLQGLYRAKGAQGYTRTVSYIHSVARRALEQAEAWDFVRKNVARHATVPQAQHTERTVLEAEDVARFFEEASGDRFEALYVVALTTGMRSGELLGLRWTDLDLKRGYLRVQRSVDTMYGPAQEKAPKRESSKRPIKLLPEAIVALEEHRKRQLEERLRAGPRWQDKGYVFPSRIGTAMSANNLRRRNLQPILKSAGLARLTFHELRHTFATLMLSGGEHPKVVQSILGHASITQTLDTYSHVLPGLQEDAAQRLRGQLFDS